MIEKIPNIATIVDDPIKSPSAIIIDKVNEIIDILNKKWPNSLPPFPIEGLTKPVEQMTNAELVDEIDKVVK